MKVTSVIVFGIAVVLTVIAVVLCYKAGTLFTDNSAVEDDKLTNLAKLLMTASVICALVAAVCMWV